MCIRNVDIRLYSSSASVYRINIAVIGNVKSLQGSIIKQVCGIGIRSHHTGILRALNVDNISTVVQNRRLPNSTIMFLYVI